MVTIASKKDLVFDDDTGYEILKDCLNLDDKMARIVKRMVNAISWVSTNPAYIPPKEIDVLYNFLNTTDLKTAVNIVKLFVLTCIRDDTEKHTQIFKYIIEDGMSIFFEDDGIKISFEKVIKSSLFKKEIEWLERLYRVW